MPAKLTFEEVRNGRAIPQPGDMVGQYVYTGGDPSDLSLYQPIAQDGYTPPTPTGSVFDPKNVATQTVQAGAAPSSGFAPTLSGVKMLLPDIPNPLSLPPGSAQFPPIFGTPTPSPGAGIFAAGQNFGADPGRFPPVDWQSNPSTSRPLIGSDYAKALPGRIAGYNDQNVQKSLNLISAMSQPQAAPILGIIRNGESFGDLNGNGADYNAVGHRPKGKSGQDFSTMTVRQVLDWQAKNGHHAVGAYQFEPPTLARFAGDLLDEPFDQQTQDALAGRLLKSLGLNDYLNGRIDKAHFMSSLSGTWRSLPRDMTGAGYHPADANNKVRVAPQLVSDALDSAKW